MIPARSKLAAPLASGALHAGLLGLIVGFGMGAVPPATTPTPMLVELVQPDVLPASRTAGGKPDMPPAPVGASSAQAVADPLKSLEHGTPRPAATVRPARPLPAARPVAMPNSPSARPEVAEKLPAPPELAPQAAEPAAPVAVTVAARTGMGEAMPAAAAGVSEAVALTGNPRPSYPWLARQRHIEGRVVLRVSVDAEGRPRGVDVARSSGFPLLDESARAAVAQWTFRPARSSGIAVPAEVEVPVAFRLAEADNQ